MLAVLATMVDLVRRLAASPWVTLEPLEGDWELERFAAVAAPGTPAEAIEGAHFVRLTGPLFFANADTLRTRIAGATDADARWVVLDLESVTDVDPTASEALVESVTTAQGAGVVVAVARASEPVRRLLDLYGVTDLIGKSHVFESNRAALAAYLSEPDGHR